MRYPRFFSSVATKFPAWLTKKVSDDFRHFPDDVRISSNKLATNGAKILHELKNRAPHDVESKNLISAIENRNVEDANLVVKDSVPKQSVVTYLSDFLAYCLNPNLRLAERKFVSEKTSLLKNIAPHSDGSKTRTEISFTMVGGLVSDASVATGTISVQQIVDNLSPTSQQILREPIFGYWHDSVPIEVIDKSALNLPILYDDYNQNLAINLMLSSRNLLDYNLDATSFKESDIKIALDEIHQTITDLQNSAQCEKHYVAEGEILVMPNKTKLHFRENNLYDANLDLAQRTTRNEDRPAAEKISSATHRVTLNSSYENPTPYPGAPQFVNLQSQSKDGAVKSGK